MARSDSRGPDRPEANAADPTETLDSTLLASPPRRDDPLERGQIVGRYLILEPIGRGGMGTVYAAYDPELERKVALKLVRPGRDPRGPERLLREAQALARLTHPNVMTVYDVGQLGSRVFVASELVEGASLDAWLTSRAEAVGDRRASSRRHRDAVLRLFQQIGAGLAAAHRAGLVHRDVKPSNIMVGTDGRPRLVDFGLASDIPTNNDTSTGPASPDEQTPAREGAVVALDRLSEAPSATGRAALTAPGRRPGTRGYMAPEQHTGRPAGPAADQYAFCVTLHEALTGTRPTSESDVDADVDAALPAWLRRVLARGLATDPDDRYPSLDQLCAALTANPRRVWSRRAAVAGVVAAWVVGGYSVQQHLARRAARCTAGSDLISSVWNSARRDQLARAIRAESHSQTATETATATATAGTARVDRYTAAWTTMHRATCEATRRTGEQSIEIMDRRMACLDRRRHELDVLLTRLATDPVASDRAVAAVNALEPLSRCADTEALLAPVALSTRVEVRAQVESLRRSLDDAWAAERLGQWAPALETARAAAEQATTLAYWPLTAEALLRVGNLEERANETDAAITSLTQAVDAAVAGGHDRVAAEALVRLVRVHGVQRTDYPRAGYYATLAEAALSRLGQPDDLAAELADHRGRLALEQGDTAGALAAHRHALTLRLAGDPEHPEVASTLLRLANVEVEQGDFDAAIDHARQALAGYERVYGPGHPRLAVAALSLGDIHYRAGRLAEALDAHRRGLDLRIARFGADDRATADARLRVANTLLALGRTEEAATAYTHVERVYTATLGPDHPRLASLLGALAAVRQQQGDPNAARTLHERALAIQRATYGDDHPWVAHTLYNLGVTAHKLDQPAVARDHFQQALTRWQHHYGPDHYLLAHALTGLGRAWLDADNPRAARAPLERALTLREARDTSDEELASTRFALARALVATRVPADRVRAHDLARVARDGFARAGATDRARDANAWLDTHSFIRDGDHTPRGDTP